LALLDYVVSTEAKESHGPLILVDDDGKRQAWHYFLISNLSDCLRELMPVSA
jgi:hypothetical protein